MPNTEYRTEGRAGTVEIGVKEFKKTIPEFQKRKFVKTA